MNNKEFGKQKSKSGCSRKKQNKKKKKEKLEDL